MTKHSPYERARRAEETARIKEIEAAWWASVPADQAKAFEREVAASRARGPLEPPPRQAPGTAPNPPRPGHEPKPTKADRRQSRSRHG
ncbi:MAG: hypothetical protein U0838_06810 [Chloroflexota bacterium]